MTDFMINLGRRLRESREQRGINLRELAEATGGYIPNLSSYEKGRRLPSLELFIRIAQTLGVSADYLLEGTEIEGVLTDEKVKEALRAMMALSPKNRLLVSEIIAAVARQERAG